MAQKKGMSLKAHALLRVETFTYCREKEFLKLVNRHPRANNYAPIARALARVNYAFGK